MQARGNLGFEVTKSPPGLGGPGDAEGAPFIGVLCE